jgi:hypothetical protein
MREPHGRHAGQLGVVMTAPLRLTCFGSSREQREVGVLLTKKGSAPPGLMQHLSAGNFSSVKTRAHDMQKNTARRLRPAYHAASRRPL